MNNYKTLILDYRPSNIVYGILSTVILFLSFSITDAQIVFYPLNNNPTIINNNLKDNNAATRTSLSADTLSLPFIDDFAQEGIYPSSDLWLDSGVFVNSTFCDNPPTVGVATFDGINKLGNRYSTSASRQYCDTLTSKPIRLAFASVQPDTMIWLSFYYQPQGLGIAPFTSDTLILLFRDSTGLWNRVWTKNGTTKQPFARVNIHITDSKYFSDRFQFRFMNYGPPNANTDHWNIDYVYLNNNRINNDDIVDFGMVNNPNTLLSEFHSMPWTHYQSVASNPSTLRSTQTDSARNINYYGGTLDPRFEIIDPTGAQFYSDALGGVPTSQGAVSSFTFDLPSAYPTGFPGDSASFLVKSYLNVDTSITNEYQKNDTSYYRQNFYNYYAYDDGSAEVNTGLSGSNLKWAMKYNVKMRDTLKAAQIYFNPTSLDLSTQLIQIAVWSNIAPPTTETLLHKMINQRPRNIDSINGFATYVFDTTLVVGPGDIWVGFIQNNNVLIGLGVDKNTDSHTKMFYAANGTWNAYTFSSTWMIRPVFGKHFSLVGVDEITEAENSFEVFPNPANDKIYFSFDNSPHHKLNYELLDIAGRTVMKGKLISEELSISKLNSGIYFVRLTDEKNRSYSKTKKIIVYH